MNTQKTDAPKDANKVATSEAPKPAPSAFDAAVAKDAQTNKAAGNTGKTATSAASRSILAKLRECGATVVGLTVEELRFRMQIGKSAQQTRKQIRTAQETAAEAGDLVFCRNVTDSVDGKGEPITLNSEVSRYYIIPGDVAATAKPDTLAILRESASDWVYKGDVKAESTRPRLAELARAYSA